jgi:hypothetical protein
VSKTGVSIHKGLTWMGVVTTNVFRIFEVLIYTMERIKICFIVIIGLYWEETFELRSES